jgi:hypothetical protein
MAQIPPNIETSVVIIYDLVVRMLVDYTQHQNASNMAPFMALLRQWKEYMDRCMESMEKNTPP